MSKDTASSHLKAGLVSSAVMFSGLSFGYYGLESLANFLVNLIPSQISEFSTTLPRASVPSYIAKTLIEGDLVQGSFLIFLNNTALTYFALFFPYVVFFGVKIQYKSSFRDFWAVLQHRLRLRLILAALLLIMFSQISVIGFVFRAVPLSWVYTVGTFEGSVIWLSIFASTHFFLEIQGHKPSISEYLAKAKLYPRKASTLKIAVIVTVILALSAVYEAVSFGSLS